MTRPVKLLVGLVTLVLVALVGYVVIGHDSQAAPTAAAPASAEPSAVVPSTSTSLSPSPAAASPSGATGHFTATPRPAATSSSGTGRFKIYTGAHPTTLFVGDSYTAGDSVVWGDGTFAPQAAATMGWRYEADAEGGTGFAATGHENSPSFAPYGSRIASDKKKFSPNYIVVTGGRNDLGSTAGLQAAVPKYFHDLRAAFPSAGIIVVTPFWNDANAPAGLVQLRTWVRSAASSVGALVITADDWLTQSLIGSDDIHPTAEGHHVLATRLVAALRSAGVKPASG